MGFLWFISLLISPLTTYYVQNEYNWFYDLVGLPHTPYWFDWLYTVFTMHFTAITVVLYKVST